MLLGISDAILVGGEWQVDGNGTKSSGKSRVWNSAKAFERRSGLGNLTSLQIPSQ